MSDYATLDDLLAAGQLGEDEVTLPSTGQTVKVRGLNRAEFLAMSRTDGDTAAVERVLIAAGMVEPRMSEEQVGQWQTIAPSGDLDAVGARIQALSRVGKAAAKAVTKSDAARGKH